MTGRGYPFLLLLPPFLSLLLIQCCASSAFPPPALVGSYTIRRGIGRGPVSRLPTEYIDPTLPPVFSDQTPTCSVHLLGHDFAYTYGSPPATSNYTPPSRAACGDWTRAVLDLSISCAGEQYDRIAAVWIDGVELLRTSTAEPTEAGVFWKVRKDVTRYSSLLRGDGRVVAMMLENIVNDVYTGVYHVDLSLDLYVVQENNSSPEIGDLGLLTSTEDGSNIAIRKMRGVGRSTVEKENFGFLHGKPADLIIPISNEKEGDRGFWFRLQKAHDVHAKTVRIPSNVFRAVLEIYVSFHSDDEFWYSNPPNDYIEKNDLDTARGNGSFRQVFATIDGYFVGSIVPYPVIFTGGINPLFWAPVVSIGAFDLPSYDLDLTPFLGNLLDGEPHEFALGVRDGIAYWLIDANLHLWLDEGASFVKAKLVDYNAHKYSISRESEFDQLDGKFKIEADQEIFFVGWVNSSFGNLTTIVEQEFKFKSSVEFKKNGNAKEVYTKSKSKTDVKVKSDEFVLMAQSQELEFPLWFQTSTLLKGNNTYTLMTNLSHALYEESSAMMNGRSYMTNVNDKQTANGWMEVEGHSVLSGFTTTEQTYMYVDNAGCYLRTVSTEDDKIQIDKISNSCDLSM